MIAWMLGATLFTLFAAIAAACGEQVLRTMGRQARGAWIVAIAASVAWPAVLPMLGTAAPVALLPTITVTGLAPRGVQPAGAAWMPTLDHLLLALWAVASLALLLRVALLLVRGGRLRRGAERRTVDGVELLVSEGIGPAVVGIVRQEIMYPRALLALEPALRGVILRHEEEHRRARDPWLMLGCALAGAAMPWNPALWWMTGRARLALEVDCDARVLRRGVSPARYGRLLLLVAQADTITSFAPALIPSRSSRSSRTHLERRIRVMLTAPSSRRTLRIATGVAGLVLASIAACSSQITEGGTPRSAGAPRVVSPQETMFEFQIEKPARVVPGSFSMHYPDELRAASITGEVLAQFVVDETGRVVPGTFKVLKATRPEFVAAVRDAIAPSRWTPAEVGGRTVKQLVQEPFTFTLDAAPVAGTPVRPNP